MQGAFRIISNGSERISDKSSIQLFIYLSTKITFVMLCTTRFEDQERVFSGFYFIFLFVLGPDEFLGFFAPNLQYLRLRKSRHANLCNKNQFFRKNVVVIAF